MKSFKLNLADFLAVLLLIIKIFAPFFAESIGLNLHILTMLINCYLIGYLAYLISFMETKKVAILALPLLLYSVFLLYFWGGFKISFDKSLVDTLAYIFTNVFDVVAVSFGFFVIELVLTRLFGAMVTNIIGILGIILYLALVNTTLIPFDFYYRDSLIYFAFFVMATRIRPANTVSVALYPLGLVLFVGEVIAYSYFKFYPGFYFSMFFITYIFLKDMDNVEGMNIERYLAFSYLYPYQILAVVLAEYLNVSGFIGVLLAGLATFVISEILYKLQLKFINFIYIGNS